MTSSPPDRRWAIAVVVLVCLVGALLAWKFSKTRSRIEFRLDEDAARREAAQAKHPLVVYTHDPEDQTSRDFQERVLRDPRVVAISKDFVWYECRVKYASSEPVVQLPPGLTGPPPILSVQTPDPPRSLAGPFYLDDVARMTPDRLVEILGGAKANQQ